MLFLLFWLTFFFFLPLGILRALAQEKGIVKHLLDLLSTSSETIRNQILDIFEILAIDGLLWFLLFLFLFLTFFLSFVGDCRESIVKENGVSIIYRILNQSISEPTLLRIATLFHNLSFDSEY